MPRTIVPIALPLALTAMLAACVRAGPPAPRNIVLMIADGAGYEHFAAASFHATGRARAQAGWRFPVVVAMSTHAAGGDYDPELAWTSSRWLGERATDSAAAITAMTTGVKTENGRLCVDPEGRPLPTLVERLERSGRATGVVSSVLFAHATPAAFVVSHPTRQEYAEIARKMLRDSAVDVIMGPGHPHHDVRGEPAAAADYRFVGGAETWAALQRGTLGVDADRDGEPDPWTVIHDRADFQTLAGLGEPPRRVLGIPRVRETLQCHRAGDRAAPPYAVPLDARVPTLAEMSLAALNVLAHHEGGFGLMIEGGAVDWAGHDGLPGRLIEEQRDFDAAVVAVVAWLDARDLWDETLLVVTSDHECGYLCAPEGDGPMPALEGAGLGRMPAMELRTGAHTNALVPLFARGARAAGLRDLADAHDPVRGPYLDNAELGAYLAGLAGERRVAEAAP